MLNFKTGSPRSGKAMVWDSATQVVWAWNKILRPLNIPVAPLTHTLKWLNIINKIAQTELTHIQPTRERLTDWIELEKQTSTLVDLLAEPAKRTSTLQGSYLLF